MNQAHQNINKDMIDSDLIDVESLDFSNDQTWLYAVPNDSGQNVDIVDWNLSWDWPINEDNDYLKTENHLYAILDNILKNEALSLPDKHKFDSRTYVKPKKRVQRPSIQSIVEVASNPPSITPNTSLNPTANKYLTYNKYSAPLGPISPMLRLKTFNVDTNTENSNAIKEYAMKRRSLIQDDDPQLEDADVTLSPNVSERLSEHTPSKPINIDLSQPAHNLHNTFNKGLTNIMNERGSLNMYQSGESLMRMSPPSLVSSLMMESSGTFNPESLDSKKSIPSHKDSGVPTSFRDSIDPMMTSMTLSILDEKDMSTSFLSQTTYPDHDSLIDSLPPSLVSSVNSSYVVTNTTKPRPDSTDSNIFSSTTFTHLEQSEKLLSARPRCQMYNSFTKRDSAIKNSESYTKSREEASQIDTVKVLNENSDKKDPPKCIPRPNPEMGETITLHYSNNKFRQNNDAEKENMDSTFEKDDAFYRDMGIQKAVDLGKNSLNVTLDKQELNEIIQARQKLSLARKALPSEPERPLPNQVDTSPIKTIQLPNQTITVPKQSMENASELLSRRRALNGNSGPEEPTRDTPKRNATFKKMSPKASAMDTTVVYVKSDENQMIDINSATLNLIDTSERTLHPEKWGSQERAMAGSGSSTDTGTFSSSSPPESAPDAHRALHDTSTQVASTPLTALRKGSKNDMMNLQSTISPIYDIIDDKSYTVTRAASRDSPNAIAINTATMVKKSSAKRDILAANTSPEKKTLAPTTPNKSPPRRLSPTNAISYGPMAPPMSVVRKTGLPTSKLRQYSSHKELSRIPGTALGAPRAPARPMVRRGVYASNPALSPTAPAPPLRRDSYTVAMDQQKEQENKQAHKTNGVNATAIATATAPTPALVRQGTETLRRERPLSQLLAPRDPPSSRPYSIAGASQLRVSRPAFVPVQRPATAGAQPAEPRSASGADARGSELTRPASGADARVSALPRPTRLPAPRRTLRPPSVYSVAPTADMDHY